MKLDENGDLKLRHATRTVLFDQDDKVAILNVTKHGYYKILGGGIEEGENTRDAARREVFEEAGCDSVITDRLGRLETAVPIWGVLDVSDGFIAKVVGEKSLPRYEDWENERGFQLEWFDSLGVAIMTIENNIVKEPGMDVLQQRDLVFLKLANKLVARIKQLLGNNCDNF